MANTLQKLALTTAGLALSFAAIDANSAQAAIVTYDVDVAIDSGSLAGENFSGFFSYDDANLTGLGSEFLGVSDLSFNFLGVEYTEADDSFGPEVEFFDGQFLGLLYSTDVAFSFVPGFFDVSEAFFAYDTPAEGAGAGDVTYTLRQAPPSTSVPEPASMLGLLALGAFGASSVLKQKA